MQIRWQFPFRLKQTQVSPLPIHAGEPHVALSVYNQSGDFPIQPFFSFNLSQTMSLDTWLRKGTKKILTLSFFLSQVEEAAHDQIKWTNQSDRDVAECCVLGGTKPYNFGGDIINGSCVWWRRRSGNLNSVHCRLLPRPTKKQNDLDKPWAVMLGLQGPIRPRGKIKIHYIVIHFIILSMWPIK